MKGPSSPPECIRLHSYVWQADSGSEPELEPEHAQARVTGTYTDSVHSQDTAVELFFRPAPASLSVCL